MSRQVWVDVVARSIARQAGWEEDSEDYDMAVETAEGIVDDLDEQGFLKEETDY